MDAQEEHDLWIISNPLQTYKGNPWSNWGDGVAVGEKYYSAIGDHLAPAGNAFVYEYDSGVKKFRQLVDLRKVLKMPDGHYTPGSCFGPADDCFRVAGLEGGRYLKRRRLPRGKLLSIDFHANSPRPATGDPDLVQSDGRVASGGSTRRNLANSRRRVRPNMPRRAR